MRKSFEEIITQFEFEELLLQAYTKYVDRSQTQGFENTFLLDSLIHLQAISAKPPYPNPREIHPNHTQTHDYCTDEVVNGLMRARLDANPQKPLVDHALDMLRDTPSGKSRTKRPPETSFEQIENNDKQKRTTAFMETITRYEQERPGNLIQELYEKQAYLEALERTLETNETHLLEDILTKLESQPSKTLDTLPPKAKELMAHRFYEKGSYQSAAELLSNLAPSPQLVDCHYQLGDYAKAIRSFEQLESTDTLSLEAGACSYLADGHLEQGARLLEVLALKRQSPEIHSLLADTYLKLSEYQQALHHINQCDGSPENRMLQAKVHLYQNPADSHLIDETIQTLPEEMKHSFLMECAELYPAKEAVPLLEQAIEMHPQRDCYLKLAGAYERLLDFRSAFNAYEQALTLESDRQTLQDQIRVARRIGEWTKVKRNNDMIQYEY
ncbi:MAG: tetratricopeptide repeat protein [Nanobdellota archaeon]